MTFSYRCSECGARYEIEPGRLVCDACSAKQEARRPLRGLLEVEIDGAAPEGWEPRDLLPVETEWFPSIPVGNTPLWRPTRVRDRYAIPELFFKDDGANPTGSLKDRASCLVSAFARKHGISQIALASTGNAGSSMAGVGAAAGLDVRLYLPANAPPAKIVQALQYGADVQRIDGSYDDAFAECMEYLRNNDALSRNTGHNPLTIEGKKTVALEIFRQLGDRVPDELFVSTGDGVIISGVYRGLEDLVKLGLAERVPRVYCVQSEGSCAVSRALADGTFGEPVRSSTLADSISVDVPAGGEFALSRLKRHRGESVIVSDQAILAAQRELSSLSGLFAEPAAATAYAGFLARRDKLDSNSVVVVLLTGNGLKDVDTALKAVTGA